MKEPASKENKTELILATIITLIVSSNDLSVIFIVERLSLKESKNIKSDHYYKHKLILTNHFLKFQTQKCQSIF